MTGCISPRPGPWVAEWATAPADPPSAVAERTELLRVAGSAGARVVRLAPTQRLDAGAGVQLVHDDLLDLVQLDLRLDLDLLVHRISHGFCSGRCGHGGPARSAARVIPAAGAVIATVMRVR